MSRAILMAAGLGARLRPLTEHTPKPLLPVAGLPMCERQIRLLQESGVQEIRLVCGYLKEKFDYLTARYDNVQIIENKVFQTVNNISSIYAAREVLREGDCYICESDLYIHEPMIFEKRPEVSGYFGRMEEGFSDDWVFEQDEKGLITRVGKGGTDCYNMCGISYFTKEDAAILADCMEEAYGKPGYEDLFWDDVVNANLDKLHLVVHPVKKGQIIEIDTVEEYRAVCEEYGQ